MKRNKLGIIAVLLLLASMALFHHCTFARRMVTYPYLNNITHQDWYQPREIVTGQPGELLPKAPLDKNSITAAARQKVIEYARLKESASLLVWHNGQIVVERYWMGFTDSSLSNSMSMAKTLLGLLVGIAIDEKRIASEDDPVSMYLGEWTGDDRAKITIRHLLQMTSGLEKNANLANPFSDVVQMFMSSDANAVALDVPADRPPGSIFRYNNVDSQMLGILLQEIYGKSLAELVSEKIWQPIGAKNGAYWLDRPDGNAKVFCCFFARGRDWLRLGHLMLNKGSVNGLQVVSKDWIEKMTTPSPAEPDYGYQVWLNIKKDGVRRKHISEPFLAQDIYWLDGQDSQRVYVIPSYNMVIVRIGERPDKWDDALLPNTLIRGIIQQSGGEYPG